MLEVMLWMVLVVLALVVAYVSLDECLLYRDDRARNSTHDDELK